VKKLLFVLLSALLVTLLIGKTVTIKYWMWDPTIKDKVEKAIEKFESLHPNIKVELTTMEPKNYWPKLRTMAFTKKLPDVFNMSSGYLEEWVKNGFLMDLTSYIENDLDKDKFFFNLFEAGKKLSGTDKYYAIPFALVVTNLYFNKDAFDEAGIPYPNENWTWFDFLNAAIKLTKDKDGDGKIDQWGFWLYGRYANIEPWIYANGGRLINRNVMRFDPNKQAIDTLKFLTSLTTKYHVSPRPKDMKGIKAKNVFPMGIAAMWVDGSWNIENIRRIADGKFRWGIAPVPQGPCGTEKVVFGWPDFIVISARTKHPKEAWEFAKFMAGEGLTIDMYMAGKIPSYKPLTMSKAFDEEGKQPPEKGKVLRELASRKLMNSFTMGWGEWRGYGPAESMGLNGLIDAVLNGDMSFDEMLQKAKENINKVLERYYK